MKLLVKKSVLDGEITIPASKSHTIRAVVIASLAEGKSILHNPLDSADSQASVGACRAMGAKISQNENWEIEGFAGKPKTPGSEIDLLNSGTSANLIAGVATLAQGPTVLTGDTSLRSRPFAPILKALNDLGASAESISGDGRAPLKISGFLKGGSTEIDGMNSQPVSSLLISCALAQADSEIFVPNLHEQPYVKMTMQWLDEQGINYSESNMERFKVKGNQSFKSFEKTIPADFSSATFPLCAAAISPESNVLLKGLDMNDAQGDKDVANMLKKMGAEISVGEDGIRVIGSKLQGAELDLKNAPDALPALAVVGCFAEGETRLVNVAHARIKETDRIATMVSELKKMGADVEELDDGLVVR
ncbi:MAG: 3-phosphoshikimate 1-carboxyvinyltransferase, partial [archaeon]|nr:3-phosphoshikimate 1-carboxyvinyltransferase [archaeon]